MNNIHSSFVLGSNFQCGFNVIIEEDVIVGDNVKLGHNVTLKSGTRVMNDVTLADYVKTTGICIIGNGVGARTGACISKSVIINDNTFIGPGVMTNHTKNVMHKRNLKEVQLITRIGYGAVIGSVASLVAGLTIGDNVVIAAGSNVYKDILEAGIYGGNPVKKIKDIDPAFILKKPADYQEYKFDEELLRKYLAKWIGFAK
jgi:UDP-2-acetamido-3-amino-2,3-dideoxy-glucuronate N-acetyltransferase